MIGEAGPLQLSAGQDGGAEAAVHAMRQAFEETSCEAFLLADASNAFNSLHRTESLLQVKYICPEFATYLMNTYHIPCKLFLPGGSFLLSKEGTTHGDNAASGFYSLSVTPLVKAMAPHCFQIWYADDAGATGNLESIKTWRNTLCSKGPALGYHPDPTKSWLVVKPDYEDEARAVFKRSDVNITEKGRKYLGSPIGTLAFCESFSMDKVSEWTQELEDLAKIAVNDPRPTGLLFSICGLNKRWLYLMRTTPGIAHLFQPLKQCITESFLVTLFREHDAGLRDVIALPSKLGGLSIFNPVLVADKEFEYSITATEPLVR